MKIYGLVRVDDKGEKKLARGARQHIRVYTSMGHAIANLKRVSGGKILEFNSGKIIEDTK